MRRFYFENEKGRRIDLNSRPCYFNSPEGLGYSSNITYGNLRNGFFYAGDESNTDRTDIRGKLIFIRNGDATPYESYAELTAFLEAASELYFIYAPEQKEYYRPVKVNSLDKSEYDLKGILAYDINLAPLSPWRTAYPLAFNLCAPQSVKNKTYSYSYPYVYSASSTSDETEIIIGGTVNGSLRLEAEGRLLNPILEVKRADGELLGKMDLTGVDIAEGETLVYSSAPHSAGIRRRTETGELEDLIDNIDLNNNNFILIPPNELIKVSLRTSNAIDSYINIYAYEYWRTV